MRLPICSTTQPPELLRPERCDGTGPHSSHLPWQRQQQKDSEATVARRLSQGSELLLPNHLPSKKVWPVGRSVCVLVGDTQPDKMFLADPYVLKSLPNTGRLGRGLSAWARAHCIPRGEAGEAA